MYNIHLIMSPSFDFKKMVSGSQIQIRAGAICPSCTCLQRNGSANTRTRLPLPPTEPYTPQDLEDRHWRVWPKLLTLLC